MLAVCYFGAKVNGGASDTMVIINSVPVTNNLGEIKHFHNFLTSSRVALTGNGFFALTKGLILTVMLLNVEASCSTQLTLILSFIVAYWNHCDL